MIKNYVIMLMLLTCGVTPSYGLSPKHLTSNINWPSSANSSTSVATIASAFNAARRAEENQFGSISANAMGNISLPTQAVWDAMTVSEKGFYLINEERTCRAGLNYGDGAVLGLPLEGVELHIQDLAEYYANYLFDYSPSGLSHNADGIYPWDRIDNNCIIGVASNVAPPLDCHEFNTRSENLALFPFNVPGQNGDVVAKCIYLWIYQDASGAWGHRAACLIQDVDPETGGTGYSNNRGSAASEGFIGFGLIKGTYQGVPESVIIVMNIFDPVAVADCDYQVIGQSNTYTPPTNIKEVTGDFNANRMRVEKLNGADWNHYLDDNGTPTNDADDILLFSIKADNQYIGTLCDGAFDVTLGVDMQNTTTRITPATAPYVTYGYDVLSRYWHVSPIKEPDNPVDIMFYYTNIELTNILAVCDSASSPSDLTWFKFKTTSNIDPNPQNGHTGAQTSDVIPLTPSFGNYGANLYAMSTVGGFSGGGGGTSQGAEGTPMSPPPLAVDLIYFDGIAGVKGNTLKWATALEVNSSHFEIEKSTDGVHFEYLSTVKSNSYSHTTSNYEVLDAAVESVNNYYRLSEEDLDGERSELGIIVVHNKNIKQDLHIYPNPIIDFVNIDTPLKYEADYQLFSIDGRIVLQGLWQKGKPLDFSVLESGQYYLKLTFDDSQSVQKIYKK